MLKLRLFNPRKRLNIAEVLQDVIIAGLGQVFILHGILKHLI